LLLSSREGYTLGWHFYSTGFFAFAKWRAYDLLMADGRGANYCCQWLLSGGGTVYRPAIRDFGAWLVGRQTGFVQVTRRVTWLQIYAVSILCGIGFTMKFYLSGSLALKV